jgi:hydroxypyruvate isomerase
MPLAEKHKVNVVMELLNSKVNHEDYRCDPHPATMKEIVETGFKGFVAQESIPKVRICDV